MSETTPMMAQWKSCKEEAKEALLFFRLGDFYEAFYDDAETISRTLGLTLTARQLIPMCGVPFHTLDGHIDKLIAHGYKVAIAEQVEEAKDIKGLVRREIVRVITPGSLIQSSLLSDKSNNYFAAIAQAGKKIAVAYIDISTGEFRSLSDSKIEAVLNEVARLPIAEWIASPLLQKTHPTFFKELSIQRPFLLNTRPILDLAVAEAVLTAQLGMNKVSLTAAELAACGTLLLHLKEELSLNLDHVVSLQPHAAADTMSLDRSTFANLEILEGKQGKKGSLFALLDETSTAMGGRLLKQWLQKPLLNVSLINARQSQVEALLHNTPKRARLRALFRQVKDLERLKMKVVAGYATPRDLLTLTQSITIISEAEGVPVENELFSVAGAIARSFIDTPPLRVSDGALFRHDVHPSLADFRKEADASTEWVAAYQVRLREETGIKTLKVGYTRAFGYYIEVSRLQAEKMPPQFVRTQTLTNAERYTTEALKTFERSVLGAEERAAAFEAELFTTFIGQMKSYAPAIQRIAHWTAEQDVLVALSQVAEDQRFTKPLVDTSNVLYIEGGRHPIVAATLPTGQPFIPNDTRLDDQEQMMLITGPNMAGKSTYIRQVALIVILAQIGSFVPARSAHIGVVDRVFSRIGASDDLARGQSTFMVEMSETAHILHNATSRSLVLLDEIGRGTSTYDGIAIAWAVAEYLLTSEGQKAKTLFATHYWELTGLEDRFPWAKNYQTAVQEIASGIVFLRQIVRGGTDKSYGIHVAKLAGLPSKALDRAEAILRQLEQRPRRKVAQSHVDQLVFL
ncbi:MAG: hypothetical protein RL235_260 [Chlamydiota bacterium]|jgi:DNA mismatch repair protein MutS